MYPFLSFVSFFSYFVHEGVLLFHLVILLVPEFLLSLRVLNAILGTLFALHCQMLVFHRWSCY